jgi:hypothetical protein
MIRATIPIARIPSPRRSPVEPLSGTDGRFVAIEVVMMENMFETGFG